jgi:hypothetical protein
MYRPAWRINQTGVRSTGALRQAFIKQELSQGAGRSLLRNPAPAVSGFDGFVGIFSLSQMLS